MESWSQAWKDIFFSGNERISKPVDAVFIAHWGLRTLLNMTEAEGVASSNINAVVAVVTAILITIAYFVVRFSPNRKELFCSFEHRVVWLISCLLLIIVCCLPMQKCYKNEWEDCEIE